MKRLTISLFAGICICVSLLSGCRVNIDVPKVDINTGASLSQNTSLTGNVDGIDEVVLDNNVGDVHVRQDDGDTIRVGAEKKVKGHSEEVRREILDNIKFSIAEEGNRAVIKARTKDGEDFWKWLHRSYSTTNTSINYEIDVPKAIRKVHVTTGVGDIQIEKLDGNINTTSGVGDMRFESLNGNINASTGVGKITVGEAVLKGAVNLKTGTGGVSIEADIKGIEKLSATTGVGKVRLTISGDTKASIKATTGVGNINGNLVTVVKKGVGGTIHQDLNGGGPVLELGTGTGDISVNRK